MPQATEGKQPGAKAAGGAESGLSGAQLFDFKGQLEEFVRQLLRFQCQPAQVQAAAIFFRLREKNAISVLGLHPAPQLAGQPLWLARAAQLVSAEQGLSSPRFLPLGKGDGLVALFPLARGEEEEEYACFDIGRPAPEVMPLLVQRLEMTAFFWRNFRQQQPGLERRGAQLYNISAILSACAATAGFLHTGMAFVNSVAAEFRCPRAALGLAEGRRTRLLCLNHVEKIDSRGQFTGELESLMDECLDQDSEILWPAPEGSHTVSREAGEYAARQGGCALLSLPLRVRGEAAGVLTLQRGSEQPFSLLELSSLRLACELASPRLKELYERDRWFGARWVAGLRKELAKLLGPQHTWAKAGAAAAFVFLLGSSLLKDDYRVSGSFALNTPVRQIIPAPFDGFLQEINVRPGDQAEAGKTVLARLDSSELELEEAQKEAERASHSADALTAERDGKLGEAKAARARVRQAEAELGLIRLRREKSAIVSPLSGTVLTGDLVHELGSPVEKGKQLFEIAPLDQLEADIFIPDEDIAEVVAGQGGKLAAAGNPLERIPFTVKEVFPLAELREQVNCFRVRAELGKRPEWLQPGMEGIAKVTAGRRPYIWIWTRKAVNWLCMKLWL